MDSEKITVDLSRYDNSWYSPGAGKIKCAIWYYLNALFFKTYWLPLSSLKCKLLRLFGASIGSNVTIKPNVRIKYPWNLVLGNNVWIGEGVWIDNLAQVEIGSNVCVSQDAYVLTGNHDYKDINFGLIVNCIKIEDGAWLGARTVTCPGVTVAPNSVITAGSILQHDTEPCGIYRGNPAKFIRSRNLGE